MSDLQGTNWIQQALIDKKLYRKGGSYIDLNKNGRRDQGDIRIKSYTNNSIPGNSRTIIGDWQDWLAIYRWKAPIFTKLGGAFAWAGKLKTTNPLHLITTVESYVGGSSNVERTYKKVVQAVTKLKTMVDPTNTPKEKFIALFNAMKAVGLLRKVRYPLVIEEVNRTPLNPVATSLIAVAIAHEMGWPVHAVRAPKHVFIRWDKGKVKVNADLYVKKFDPHRKDIFPTDKDYMGYFKLTRRMIRKSVYLRSLRLKGLTALILRMRGEARYYRDDLSGAEADLEAALKIDYFYVRAWNILGIIKKNIAENKKSRSKAVEAEKAFNNALKLNPTYVDAFNNRGNLYLDALEMPKKAITDYTAALTIEKLHKTSLYNRGRAYFQVMNYAAAKRDLEAARRLMPRSGYLRNYLGLVYAELKEPHKAETELKLAIQYARNNYTKAKFAFNLARLYHRRRKFKSAAAYYSKTIRFNPSDAVAWFKLGTVMEELKKLSKALHYYGKAIRLANKRYARAYVRRAQVYIKRGDYLRAAMDLRAAKTLDEDLVDRKLIEEVKRKAAAQTTRKP